MDERQGRASPAPRPALWRRNLEGRRALVVGGSGGIGAAFSAALAARGAEVVIHGGASQERLEAAIASSRSGAAAWAEAGRGPVADISGFLLPLESPRDLVERLPSLGRIDLLVCSFGPFVRKPLHETSAAEWERLALLDLALPGALASALVGPMADRGWGRFLFLGGTRTDAIRAYSMNAAYAAAKTGLGVLAKSLAAEYASRGIGAFVLCPGFVDTEYLSGEARARYAAAAPGGVLLEARPIAEFGVDLMAADPPIASGAVINLDGGLKL